MRPCRGQPTPKPAGRRRTPWPAPSGLLLEHRVVAPDPGFRPVQTIVRLCASAPMSTSHGVSSEADSRVLGTGAEGQRLADKYVLGRVLGLGGMGVVRAAHDERLDRQV